MCALERWHYYPWEGADSWWFEPQLLLPDSPDRQTCSSTTQVSSYTEVRTRALTRALCTVLYSTRAPQYYVQVHCVLSQHKSTVYSVLGNITSPQYCVPGCWVPSEHQSTVYRGTVYWVLSQQQGTLYHYTVYYQNWCI